MYRIRYGNAYYRRDNAPKWKWARRKSGDVATFNNRSKARRFIEGHRLRLFHDRVEIVPVDKRSNNGG